MPGGKSFSWVKVFWLTKSIITQFQGVPESAIVGEGERAG
jgi:hypothetical protein